MCGCSLIAQLVERRTVNPQVPGSSPGRGATEYRSRGSGTKGLLRKAFVLCACRSNRRDRVAGAAPYCAARKRCLPFAGAAPRATARRAPAFLRRMRPRFVSAEVSASRRSSARRRTRATAASALGPAGRRPRGYKLYRSAITRPSVVSMTLPATCFGSGTRRRFHFNPMSPCLQQERQPAVGTRDAMRSGDQHPRKFR
jgi:hypothetical protein